MRILVTGAAGFIGSHLCEALLARGDRVIGVDNLLTGSRANLRQLERHARFELRVADIVEPLAIEVDRIFNLACPASPVHYQTNPVQTVQTNVVGTYNVLELARRIGARVLQASTSEVYGDPAVQPQPEDYHGNVNPIGPRACYDEGKRCAETLMSDYHRQRGVEVRIARIFNTYGPRMALDDGRVVSNFAVAALTGAPLELYGDGTQTRSFCYVDDLVAGLVALMEYDGADAAEPVNLGHPREIAIGELAELIVEIAGSSSTVARRDPLPDDPGRRRPDISRAAARLGWRPTIELRDGLARTIEYFEEALKSAGPPSLAERASARSSTFESPK